MSLFPGKEPISITLHIKGSKVVQILDRNGQPLPEGSYVVVIDEVVVERRIEHMKRGLWGRAWRLAVFPIMLVLCLINEDTIEMTKLIWRDIWTVE